VGGGADRWAQAVSDWKKKKKGEEGGAGPTARLSGLGGLAGPLARVEKGEGEAGGLLGCAG
jgi:hypothetical protein